MQEHVPRVLVVDDEEHITELLSMGLSMNGFEVERAATGRGALKAIEEQRPDLVVLDVMLPDLNGFDVTKRLRQAEGAGTRIPVIFLTARDTTADKIEGLRLGSDDYMTKPFSIEELVERVKAVLRRSARHRAGLQPARVRRPGNGPRDEGRLAGRPAHRTDSHRVQIAPLFAGQRPPGPDPGPNPRERMGVHLLR